MTNTIRLSVVFGIVLLTVQAARPDEALPPIEKVEIGKHAELRVNGKPFLPIMIWLQSDARIPDGLSIGVNTFAANGGQLSKQQYLDALATNGLYGVIHFDDKSIGHSHLLGWIHGDEPDLPQVVNDAQVVPGVGLRLNNSTPLTRIVDGVTHSWSVLDPLQEAEVTIRLKEPATIHSLGTWLTISSGLAVARDVTFLAGDKEILEVSLENKKGEQRFQLHEPIQVSSLTLRIRSTYPGEQAWGSISEIAGYDAQGNNVLLSPPRSVPRSTVDHVATAYRKIKQADTSRPVFVTFTAHFMSRFEKYDAPTKARLYPEFMKYCDVAGFDVYPIFGWGKPEWLDYVAHGVSELRTIAGPRRPLYAWIETNKGSRWVSPERQMDVRPQDTRAEVWMAIIRGATAIGYFTHSWVPDYRQFAPNKEMVAELSRLNGQLTRWAPAILSEPAKHQIKMTLGDGLAGHFKATEFDGHLYIFAQNIEMQRLEGKATISVEGLSAGTAVEVLDEDRTIVADDGRFVDQFAPLAEHLYRAKL